MASTRIRCLKPLKTLRAAGLPVELFNELRLTKYGIVVFLKAYNEQTLRMAERVKQQGSAIVFDLCDNHFLMHEDRVRRLRSMFDLADHWVASTPNLAAVISHELDAQGRIIHVIPDAVEDVLTGPACDVWGKLLAQKQLLQLRRFLHNRNHRHLNHLVWFGNHRGSYENSGLAYVRGLKQRLESLPPDCGVTLTCISNSRQSFDRVFREWRIPVFYMDWSAHTFFAAMRLHQIAIIPSDINEFTRAKTNNRLAVSLQLGLAVVADSIDSYKEFSACTELDDWEGGLPRYIRDSELRSDHVGKGRRIIADRYSLPVVAHQWQELLTAIART